MSFKNIFIIGLGLIGGSLAKALKKQNPKQIIGAFDQDQNTIKLALNQKIIDYGQISLEKIDQEIDLIVICTPLSSYQNIFDRLVQLNKTNSTIIDFGSVKNFKIPKKLTNFIPCHPLTGSHLSGFENSQQDLFANSLMIICKQDSFLKNNHLINLFSTLKLNCQFMSCKEHDQIFALTSHLPQFLSFLILQSADKITEINKSNSFYKALRLDKSDPKIWHDIFKSNERNIEKYYLEFFDNFSKNIFKLTDNLTILNKINFFYKKYQAFCSYENLDEQLFYDNFVNLFLRVIIVISFLEIKDLKKFENFIGNGFKDFISILQIAQLNPNKIGMLIDKNLQNFQKIFNSLNS